MLIRLHTVLEDATNLWRTNKWRIANDQLYDYRAEFKTMDNIVKEFPEGIGWSSCIVEESVECLRKPDRRSVFCVYFLFVCRISMFNSTPFSTFRSSSFYFGSWH